MSRIRLGFRTISATAPLADVGSHFVADLSFGSIEPDGANPFRVGGQLDLSRWGDRYLQHFAPVCSFVYASGFNAEGNPVENDVLLELVDPDPDYADSARQVIIEQSGVSSFVEDNLGHGWVIPYRRRSPNLPWLIEFSTSGDGEGAADVPRTLAVQLWWEPLTAAAYDIIAKC
jgi:hypothetical protein